MTWILANQIEFLEWNILNSYVNYAQIKQILKKIRKNWIFQEESNENTKRSAIIEINNLRDGFNKWLDTKELLMKYRAS